MTVDCPLCNRKFATHRAWGDHERNSPKHTGYFSCSICCVFFQIVEDLHEHEKDEHPYCDACERPFESENNLRTHLQSSLHQSRTLVCPGRKCSKRFISAAGLLHHLESGTCRSGMSRDKVNRLAVKYDTTNVVTNPTRLVQGPDGYTLPQSTIISVATSLAWNGSRFECFLCHREYQTLDRLNQHLVSPAHDNEIYRCPESWQGCGMEFRTLSALCQHVESERCGIRRFNDPMQSVIGSMASALKGLVL